MSWALVVIGVFIGFVLGLGTAFALKRESETQRKASTDAVLENVKASFGSLSLQALSKSTEEFLKLAKEKLESEREAGAKELDAKKGLIDQQLQRMSTELGNVSNLMKELEKDRAQKFGELTNQLRVTTEQTVALMQTTNALREALASAKARGQWGERMAEDVLRRAGFIENVNYLKQKAIELVGSRPDFTFLLPNNLRLNMDVKFPLENYKSFIEAESEGEKEKCCKNFLKDVRNRIKEVTTREYINTEQNTVDYVLLFIPNEQIYTFIHERDNSILDYGIENKVVICSPITLFAVLAVIRQAVDNFTFQQTSNEILSLLGTFNKQWGEFVKKLRLVGKRIDEAHKEYDVLITTRQRQLEKPLNRIEYLRKAYGLPVAPSEDEDTALVIEAGKEDSEDVD